MNLSEIAMAAKLASKMADGSGSGSGGSGGKLYMHNIMASTSAINGNGLTSMFLFIIYRSTAVPLTENELVEYLSVPRPCGGFFSVFIDGTETESAVNPLVIVEGENVKLTYVRNGLLQEITGLLSDVSITYMGITEV